MLITVHGEHSLELSPERGTVHLRIEQEGDDPVMVMSSVRHVLSGVVSELDELASAQPSPIGRRTVDPPVTNHWSESLPDGSRREHHTATARVTVRFDDPGALSRPVARWGERAGVQVEGVEWSLTEATRAGRQQEVVLAAVQDARERAAVYARAAGLGEPRLVELADPGLLGGVGGGTAEHGGRDLRAFASSAEAVTPEPAPLTLRARVHARFET